MNDITLFKCFDNSFAPSNAEEEIKSLASFIVSDCEEDAVAEVIEVVLNGPES